MHNFYSANDEWKGKRRWNIFCPRHIVFIHEPLVHLTSFATATSQPTVSLANSTLQSLSISWSVMSPQDVTNYKVFWWKESAEISKSVALDDTKFVIEGLLSNTAYHVEVLASGPRGNVNSTSVSYTAPNKVQGKCIEI